MQPESVQIGTDLSITALMQISIVQRLLIAPSRRWRASRRFRR